MTFRHLLCNAHTNKQTNKSVDLWARIDDTAPPHEPATLLLGQWQPGAPILQRMWLHLRVALLHAAWKLRQRRARGGAQYTAAGVVALACHTIEAAIQADYLAATTDLPFTAGLGKEWFRGRTRGPSGQEEFEEWWCRRGVLARVGAGSGGTAGPLLLCIPRLQGGEG